MMDWLNEPEIGTATLLARTRHVVGKQEGYGGQLKAEALVAALALDARAARPTAACLSAVPDARIIEAARDLSQALNETGSAFTLPFGTRVCIGKPGSVEIVGRVYVRRVNVPGLHPIETTPRDAHGFNLEFLRTMIYSRGSSPTCRHVGLPSPAIIGDGGVQHLLEFPPLNEAAGAVLTYMTEDIDAARFCAAPTLSLERFSAKMVKGTQWLWRRRNAIGNMVQQARIAAEAGIEAANGQGHAVVLGRICIDARSIETSADPSLRLEYLGLDDALRRGRLLDVVACKSELTIERMLRTPHLHAQRMTRIGQLRALGADGQIDALAAGIARAAPEGPAAVLQRLSRDLETDVVIPTDAAPFHAILYWKDGVIRTKATIAKRLTIEGVKVLLQAADPPSSATIDPVGKTLSDVIDLPFVCDCTIERPENPQAGGLPFLLRTPGSLVNTATGHIWNRYAS